MLIKKFCDVLSKLESNDPVRGQLTDQLLEKLYAMGLIDDKKSLVTCANTSQHNFCRRRLPVVLVRNKFCENLRTATTFIQQGRIFTLQLLLLFFSSQFSLPPSTETHEVTCDNEKDIRIGPQVVTDPAFFVTRNLEDLITWVDQSKINQKVKRYNNMLDDYELFN